MNRNPLTKGAILENFTGLGTVTRGMVRERAVELALINGRRAQDVTKADWDQAKRELTGGSDEDPNEALLDSVPESERWDVVQGSMGYQVPETPGDDDEDDDGRGESAQLVEEGVAEAEHDQMLQAAIDAASKE